MPIRSLPLLHLVRSPGLVFFPVLALVAIASCLRQPDMWLGSWDATGMQIRNSVLLLAPLAAGLGAWAGRTEARHRLGPLLAGGRLAGWVRVGAGWLAALTWCLLAYLAGVLAAAVNTWPEATWGHLSPVLVAQGALAVTAYTSVGFAVGAMWNSLFAAPFSAIAVFFAGAAAAFESQSGWRHLVPYNSDTLFAGESYRGQVIAAQLAWLVALIVLAAGLALLARKAASRGVAGGLLAFSVLAASGSAYAAVDAGPDWSKRLPRLSLDQLSCARGEVTICVHPDRRRDLEGLTGPIGDVHAALAGVPGRPRLYVQSLVVDTLPADAMSFAFVSRRADVPTVVRNLVSGLTFTRCTTQSAPGNGLPTGVVAQAWLTHHGAKVPLDTLAPSAHEAVTRLDTLADGERTRFLGEVLSAARACGDIGTRAG